MLLVALILVFILLFMIIFTIKNKTIKQVPMETVKVNFSNKNGQYVATGNTGEFIIKKDNRFEFLVKDGVIIACKDNSRHQEFIYYKEV
ncbi:hypothetical protein [Bacillus sp. FJAT-29814]|uniref:hypothetical protein n=1 Tax=Bacillus sp. FJAT-29814 TaxID=1729688 RepID=UPI00083487AC|nr:hypothetical protein [Bacillus sp. FJAT-29814]